MITTTPLPPLLPAETDVGPPAHHVGSPPTSFINPWPSFDGQPSNLLNIFKAKWGPGKPPFVPVPENREGLVGVRVPDWGAGTRAEGMKVTWIGHASFLVEMPGRGGGRGVRVLCDPVFSERTSPVKFLGPKRYTPVPCGLEEVPEVDVVVISHDHYDHLDVDTIRRLYERRKEGIHFFGGLGLKSWFVGCGIPGSQVHELDWWEGKRVEVQGVGTVDVRCTPTQHFSGRGVADRGKRLWCSWVLTEPDTAGTDTDIETTNEIKPLHTKRLFFAGDTGYRSVHTNAVPPNKEADAKLPHCPAFAEIGEKLGPFDLALLPIGLCNPRSVMSNVHCNPWDSVQVHRDVRARRSIGMHYGTVRGGISQEYEDVRDPPKWWKMAAEEEGLSWGVGGKGEIGLMNVGETVVIE